MRSALISFDGGYYEYHGGEKEEQSLAIGGYELVFLAKLIESYLFEKAKTLMKRTTYHGIYKYGGLVVFKVKNRVQEINNLLADSQ